MHVAVDGIRLFYNSTGLGNYARSVVRALAGAGDDTQITVLTPGTGDGRTLWKPPPGVATQLPPTWMRGRWRRQLWRTFALGRAARFAGADILHGLSHDLPRDLRRCGVPGVVTMHDLIYLKYPEWFPRVDRRFYDWKFRHACAVAQRIVAISEATRADLVAMFGIDPARIDVVYQPVDPRFERPVPPAIATAVKARHRLVRPYVIQVGTIEPRKNAVASVQALAALGSAFDGDLVLVGRAKPYVAAVRERARQLGVLQRVHILGDVATDDVTALLAGARAAVYPSLAEGFGLPVLEAVAAGVPIVTSLGHPFDEAGGEAALYVDPRDPDALAGTLQAILDDGPLRVRLAAARVAHVARFGDAAIAEALKDVYRRVLA